jgi:hypothetical protein
VVFEVNRRWRTINGFLRLTSLVRIEIPSSVEAIDANAFRDSAELSEVIFDRHSHLGENHDFMKCSALSRIVIPSSVELIVVNAFHRCTYLREVTLKRTAISGRLQDLGFAHHFHRWFFRPLFNPSACGPSMNAPGLAVWSFHSGVNFETTRDCGIAIA